MHDFKPGDKVIIGRRTTRRENNEDIGQVASWETWCTHHGISIGNVSAEDRSGSVPILLKSGGIYTYYPTSLQRAHPEPIIVGNELRMES